MPYKDPEKKKAFDKAYLEANKEKIRLRHKAYHEANKEKRNAYSKAYREANKEKGLAYAKDYYKENKDKANARSVKRKALKTRSILPTTDDELIKKIYKQRAAMTEEYGEPYHVDHIVPLSIGGAHHQDNLRITTAEENMKKYSKYTPELGGVWADNKLARKNRKKYEAL